MILNQFKSVRLIEKGWSKDIKYHVIKDDETSYLLRITSANHYQKHKDLFDALNDLSKRNILMSLPKDIGLCEAGVFTLYTWIDGFDAEDYIPKLTEDEQYLLGKQAGFSLKEIHTIKAPSDQEDWSSRFNRKLDHKIEQYRLCNVRFDGDDKVIDFINMHKKRLQHRKQCFQHGDFHIGNMMIKDRHLYIIDFDRFDFGDPWEDFNRIVWSAQKAPKFAKGIIDAYFNCHPPKAFWELLCLYICSNMLSSVYWAIPYGQKEIDVMMHQIKDILKWYDHFNQYIPSWYKSFDSKRNSKKR